ncbi:hypothetical protein [Streptomyces sp. S.PB5]|nr:hypothetical protein [Streptomyces sp. S.PB5]MDN3020340.1 hypothetical protein [Streptomyces sp. S.PB5]
MTLFRDHGIVLRTRKPGAADRIMLCPAGGHRLEPRPESPERPESPGGAR